MIVTPIAAASWKVALTALIAASEAVAAGDLRAIDALLKVLDRMDRFRKEGARKAVYDDDARKRLFAKLNRLAAHMERNEPPVAAAALPATPRRREGACAPFALNLQ
jgi:hypothetical protein